MTEFSIEPLAEGALLLRFGDGIDIGINTRVHAAARVLHGANLPGIIDIAPAYASLLVQFVPARWVDHACADPFARLAATLKASLDSDTRRDDGPNVPRSQRDAGCIVEIPVRYGDEHGPDLDAVADHAELSRTEVIARHAAAEYSVAMLGFAPGFPYLLGLDPTLHTPRLATPRTRVPAGSVAIGGAQTGIYPCALPGGWHLIGRAPLALFDPEREPPCLLAPGDRVRFRAIEADEFAHLAEHDA